MTTHPLVPADIDADSLADLVLDCTALTGIGTAAPLRFPAPRPKTLHVDDATRSLTDGMADYGV